MREIKFRVWDKRNKKMYFLTEGSLVGIDYEVGVWAGGWELCAISAEKGKYVVCGQEEGHRDDGVLMQFTGLKDKKGKKVYEGDVLKSPKSFMNPGNYRLDYVPGGFTLSGIMDFKTNMHLNCHGEGFTQHFEVIGNIWENPELLKI